MTSQGAPPNPVQPPPSPQKNTGLLRVIIVVVALVVVIAAIAVIYHETHLGSVTSSSNLKVAVLPSSTIDSLAGTTLTVSTRTFTTSSNYTTVKAIEEEFNKTTNGSFSGSIIIVSAEFASSSQVNALYNQVYENVSNEVKGIHNVKNQNESYKGFSYFLVSYTESYLSDYIVIGHNGKYFFEVLDINVYVSNINALVYDEISAM